MKVTKKGYMESLQTKQRIPKARRTPTDILSEIANNKNPLSLETKYRIPKAGECLLTCCQ